VNYWAHSFEKDLERACRDHFKRRCWGIGFGLNYMVVSLSLKFRKLSPDHIVSSYKRTYNRAILLDYDGTMMPQTYINKTPSPQVISVVNSLCSDHKNIVFIVSGRGKKSLSECFSPFHKLGIAAEHGYFMRQSLDTYFLIFINCNMVLCAARSIIYHDSSVLKFLCMIQVEPRYRMGNNATH